MDENVADEVRTGLPNDVLVMIDHLRSQYRGRLLSDAPLQADSALYDKAHAVYDSLEKGTRAEARLWAVLWIYELLISPHRMQYMTWPSEGGTADLAEFLGDFETRRVLIGPDGKPDAWTDDAEVSWDDGVDLRVGDQPMDFEAALRGGAAFVARAFFETAWKAAKQRRAAGTPNPMLAPSVVATFEELRIARGEVGRFCCPVCKLDELDTKPYELWPPPSDLALFPPYENQLGHPSYEVCPMCGFEFGNDDNPGTAPPVSFDEYRRDWRARGAPRFRR